MTFKQLRIKIQSYLARILMRGSSQKVSGWSMFVRVQITFNMCMRTLFCILMSRFLSMYWKLGTLIEYYQENLRIALQAKKFSIIQLSLRREARLAKLNTEPPPLDIIFDLSDCKICGSAPNHRIVRNTKYTHNEVVLSLWGNKPRSSLNR